MKRIRIHCLTDGRDCEDGSSVKLMTQLVKECEEVSKGGCDSKVASGGGRMRVTMDRYEVRPESRAFNKLNQDHPAVLRPARMAAA